MNLRGWRPIRFQSQEVKAIFQHMTPQEKWASRWRAMLIGGVLGVAMLLWQAVVFLTGIYGHPLLAVAVVLGGCLFSVVMIGRVRKRNGELLCSTSWAQSQGYRPENLPVLRPLSRKATILLVLVMLFGMSGFWVLSGTAYRAFRPQPSTPTQLVASWRWYGVWLPDATEARFLRKGLPGSLNALGVGLADPNTTVRRCTAQVIEELGPSAKPLLPNLKAALTKETDPLVRVYFAKAFGPIGDSSAVTLSFLRMTLSNETDAEAKNYLQDSIDTLATKNKE